MAKVDPEREKVFWKIVDETMELLSIDNRRITFRERIGAIAALERILFRDKSDDADAGRTIRRYQRSFTQRTATKDGASGRGSDAGFSTPAELVAESDTDIDIEH